MTADHVLLFEEVVVFTSMKQGKEKKKKDLLVSIPLEYLWSLEAKKEEAKPTQAEFTSIAEGNFYITFESASQRVVFCATVYHYQARLLQKRAIKTCTGDVMVNRFLSVRGEDGKCCYILLCRMLTRSTGNDAEGYFERAKLHGSGKMTWKSGASFVVRETISTSLCSRDECTQGGWIDGRMSGQGKFTYKTGEVLEGQWKDTAPHGKLLFTCPDGTYGMSYKIQHSFFFFFFLPGCSSYFIPLLERWLTDGEQQRATGRWVCATVRASPSGQTETSTRAHSRRTCRTGKAPSRRKKAASTRAALRTSCGTARER